RPAFSTVPLHDALPICVLEQYLFRPAEQLTPARCAAMAIEHLAIETRRAALRDEGAKGIEGPFRRRAAGWLQQQVQVGVLSQARSEEHTSELQSRETLV